MRKFLVPLVFFLVALVALGAAASALAPGNYVVGDDLPAGWYSLAVGESSLSSLYLPSGCSVTVAEGILLQQVEVKGFTLEAGIYTVGTQVPPGLYSIEAMPDNFANYRIKDDSGKSVLVGVVDFERNGRIGSIQLLDGFTVEFDRKVRFGPASGLQYE